jgi:hypothetical protein
MFLEEKNVENKIANLSYRHVHKVLINRNLRLTLCAHVCN